MPSVAIIVGNTTYRSLQNLSCCAADILSMKNLLDATGKYENIHVLENLDSNNLKSKIRFSVDNSESIFELFFYYTGHGYAHEDEFYYCATDFDASRPNETGLSTSELHTLLKLSNADIVVKVVDACNSGVRLIKSDVGLTQQNKYGFKNLVQISSCLDTQFSLTGDPLSLFTDKFIKSALSKSEGVVHYLDIISALRDKFLDNETQVPFFVQQGTGREEFIDDAHKLDRLREEVILDTAPSLNQVSVEILPVARPLSLTDFLLSAEAKVVTPERLNSFVGSLFDSLKVDFSEERFSDLYEMDIDEHDAFVEPTAERFIIEVMSREKRSDNFVTADVRRKRRRNNPLLGSYISTIWAGMYDDEQFSEVYELELNCKMPRVQMRVRFTPKFSSLQRIVLVVTCAPSVDNCYVFEIATVHMMRDFGKYDEEGEKIVKRWYKFDWDESPSGVVKKISDTLREKIEAHIESVKKRLIGEN